MQDSRFRMAGWLAGAALLVAVSLTTFGCSGGGGGAVQTLGAQAVASFAGWFAGTTVLGADFPLNVASGDVNGDGVPDLVATAVNFVSEGSSLVVQTAVAPGQFGEPTVIGLEGAFTFGLALEDFDEDGFLDVAVANAGGLLAGFDGNHLLLFLNQGDGTFGEPATVLLGGFAPFGLVAGDFDEDGFADLAATTESTSMNGGLLDNAAVVVLGEGDGTFGAPQAFATGIDCPLDIETADLTGDGNLDLALSDDCGSDVVVLEGNGDGTFDDVTPNRVAVGGTGSSGSGLRQLHETWARGGARFDLSDPGALGFLVGVGGASAFLVLDDFNNDGIVDIASTLPEGNQTDGLEGGIGSVAVVLGVGGGDFGSPEQFPITGIFASGLAGGDFDGDGNLDLAAGAGSGEACIFMGDGTGGFTETEVYPVGSDPFGLMAADLDLDGRQDLVSANEFVANLTFLRGQGDGTFVGTPRAFLGVFEFPTSIATGDVDGDGLDDVVVALDDTDFRTGAEQATGSLAVLLNEGGGTFGEPSFFDFDGPPRGLALGDMNGDGRPDAVVSRVMELQEVVVLLNDGAGGFGAPGGEANIGAPPDHVALADFNGDGDLDAAVAVFDQGAVVVAPGDGAGGFGDPEGFDTLIDGFDVLAADLDGDGFPDLALAGGNAPGEASVLLNDGTGSFGDATVLETDHFATLALASGDFDGDGFPDLVTADVADIPDGFPVGGFTLFRNDGQGGFGAPESHTGGFVPVDLHAADVNRDGRLDLVAIDGFLSSAGVTWGNGDGTFGAVSGFNAGPFPVGAALGNFNGDAFPDLAAANEPTGKGRSRVSAQQVGNDHSTSVAVLNSIAR